MGGTPRLQTTSGGQHSLTVTRVLLADDSEDFLNVVSEWLTSDPQIRIVGVARSGADAVRDVLRLTPDVVLMDASISGINGFEATRRIKAEPDAPAVILLTFHESESARNEAWAAGADEILAKAHVTDGLLQLVRDTVSGRGGQRETSSVKEDVCQPSGFTHETSRRDAGAGPAKK